MNNILTQHTNVSDYKQPDLVAMLLNDKRSENTKRAYRFDINHFFIYLTGSISTETNVHKFISLSRNKALEIVLTYKNWLITNEKLAESTINRKISAIRSLVSLAKTLGYCDYDLSEVAHEKIKTYRDTTGIDLDEFKQMLKVPNKETLKGKRDYAILILFFETAIRRGEVTKINLADYEPEKNIVWIIGKGRGTQKESITISNLLVSAINDYLITRQKNTRLTVNESLFATTDRRTAGSRMSGEALRRLVRNIAIQAGIKKPLSPHKLRHSAITIALDQTNGDVRAVQKLSRHTKIDTLLIYDDNRQNQQGKVTELLSGLL